MGINSFFSRIFGGDKPENASTDPTPKALSTPTEHICPKGKSDQSGLAKRLPLAFDQAPDTQDFDNL